MSLSCGIVGLPNVGKSTLFNALTAAAVAADNFPFCTIEPNSGVAPVPDGRLDRIAEIAESAQRVPAAVNFVDVAGLVKGAAEGEGLGNKFLGHIRDTNAIVQVLRCFQDEGVIHVSGRANPEDDLETIHLELLLADLQQLDRAVEAGQRSARDGSRDKKERLALLQTLREPLRAGKALRHAGLDAKALALASELRLLSLKPMLYLANLSEDHVGAATLPPQAQTVRDLAERDGAGFISCCNSLEAELVQLAHDEQHEMLEGLGLQEPALNLLAREAYAMLGLITFFTAGPKEARAWSISRGEGAAGAAGSIHSDMERGFIRAEIIGYEQYIECGGEAGARKAGQLRLEGRDYLVQDGDVAHFRFNV